MSLDFESTFGALANKSGTAGVDKKDRPKTQIWLNIGYDCNGKFINLPVGIPIDTTQKMEAKGQNVEWNQQVQATNMLLEMLQKHGAKMEAGTEEVVSGLTIKIKRIAAPMEVDPESNVFALPNGGISFGG